MAAAHRNQAKFRELRARGEAALIPFIVAGESRSGLRRDGWCSRLEARAPNLIELGVPFSDPMADVLQPSVRRREESARARRWRRFSRW